MSNKTFCGEYCGNPDFQHIIKYQGYSLYFYAICDNNSGYACIDPEMSYSIFNKYGL